MQNMEGITAILYLAPLLYLQFTVASHVFLSLQILLLNFNHNQVSCAFRFSPYEKADD